MVGKNDEVARRAGIKVPRVKKAAFAIFDGIAALAGVIGATPIFGVGVFSGGGVGRGTLVLESVAAAVIGSVSLVRDRGSIYAVLFGALVRGNVLIGLNLMGVENEIRLIGTGLLLVLVVSIDKITEKATGQRAFYTQLPPMCGRAGCCWSICLEDSGCVRKGHRLKQNPHSEPHRSQKIPSNQEPKQR